MNPYYIQELQNMRDKIDNQLRTMPQPITQNFQITPNSGELEGRYANTIEDVKNTFVLRTGLFISKDCKNLWIKDTNGQIRIFDLKEVKELDEKDKEIESLKKEIEEMKGVIYAKRNNENANEQTSESETTRVQDDNGIHENKW